MSCPIEATAGYTREETQHNASPKLLTWTRTILRHLLVLKVGVQILLIYGKHYHLLHTIICHLVYCTVFLATFHLARSCQKFA
jgi:hypothetical protein